MPTQTEVPGIVAEVRLRLAEASNQGVQLQVIDDKLEDDWFYVVVAPSQPGVRALDHANTMANIEPNCGERERATSSSCPLWRSDFADLPAHTAVQGQYPHQRANKRFDVSRICNLLEKVQMNEPAAPVTIILRVPGKWSQPSELVERLPAGCRLMAEHLVLPNAAQVEWGAMQADDEFAEIFRSSCRQPATADELATVNDYTVNVFLSGPGGSLATARTMMQAGRSHRAGRRQGVFIDNLHPRSWRATLARTDRRRQPRRPQLCLRRDHSRPRRRVDDGYARAGLARRGHETRRRRFRQLWNH